MRYQETHNKSNFHQGLKNGNVAIFYSTGDKYTLHGWEKVEEKVLVIGFNYPHIITNKGRFHYSRYVASKQLELF